MFVPASAYTVGTELSYLGFGREDNSKTAQPYKKTLLPGQLLILVHDVTNITFV